MEQKFRHEYKQSIDTADLAALRQRLSALMQPDSFSCGGKYEVRSLYFDNLFDKALIEKINGVNYREKFRIRLYNGDTSFIRLEKKSKARGLSSKQSAILTYEQADSLARGASVRDSGSALLDELALKMDTQRLKPKTIVDYTREAFVFPAGNVRVTLDYNIRTGLNAVDFLDSGCVTVPAGAEIILEVKWDEFLPSFIAQAVQLGSIQTSSFSKYAACRIYG
ncbi:MAG: polyphosphate polymerase domain-containing protein [Oscillospiraceae bacterium]